MTTFILAPAARTAADQVVVDPKAMLDAGLLVAYSERANGTTRRLELCPVGSTRRDTAEWISERLDEGATLKTVARELHVSLPTVRRFIMALELTEEIEAGDWNEVWAAAQGFDLQIDPETEDRPEVLALAAFGEQVVACSADSTCAVHGDGTTVAADQDCPIGGEFRITVTI
jgi:hypothetical protein